MEKSWITATNLEYMMQVVSHLNEIGYIPTNIRETDKFFVFEVLAFEKEFKKQYILCVDAREMRVGKFRLEKKTERDVF